MMDLCRIWAVFLFGFLAGVAMTAVGFLSDVKGGRGHAKR